MIDTNRIEALAAALDGTLATELVVVEGERELRLVRNPSVAAAPVGEASANSGTPPAGPQEHTITARRVGVYHRPQRPVHPGDRIESGEIVGYIDSMRILNEVIAEASGVVAQVYVEDGSPVEYGQELILLRESTEG